MNITALRDHLISVVAGAAVLSGGATLISSKIDLTVLTERVDKLEKLNENVEGLRSDLQTTREELIRSQLRDDRK
ncbi:hypothetical protein [Novosphingobium sp.]|uniref:hypothetical protein n=1 Tax=Novosphingobium sp. TaxID=1874826 RepID=UPI003D6D1830